MKIGSGFTRKVHGKVFNENGERSAGHYIKRLLARSGGDPVNGDANYLEGSDQVYGRRLYSQILKIQQVSANNVGGGRR